MSTTGQQMNKLSARPSTPWGLGLLTLALISPVPLALAEQPAPMNVEQSSQTVQRSTIDPITGLVYGTLPSVNGVAMTVDAEGHPRAFCADPADSLAPAAMRDAIQPNTSRLRYE